MLKHLVLALVVVLFTAGLFAQNRTAGFGARVPLGAGHGFTQPARRNFSGFPEGFRRRGFRHGFLNGPYLYPGYFSDYYPDYSYDYEPPPPAASPEPAAAPQFKQEPVAAPALLELQGNQWVKVTSFTMGRVPGSATEGQTAPVAKELPPTVLVYRDGHTEELTNYSIIGNSIYTKSNYWTSGAWTRAIQIADLDIPSTLKQNQQRGVKFELPSGPNEVMIRP